MIAYSPEQWDERCKQLQKLEFLRWKRDRENALTLLTQALEEIRDPESNSVTLMEARSDLKLANRALSKPAPPLGASSFMGQTAAYSHAQALADLKVLPVRPTADSKHLPTYKRLMNIRKRVRRLIRASGGQAG